MPVAFASIQAKAAQIFASMAARLAMLGIIAALIVNTYVEVRVPLPLLPDIHWEGWKPKAQRLQGEIDGFAKAQEEAQRLAQQQKEEYEEKYRELSERASDDHEQGENRAMDAAERYIAGNRVCPADRGAASGTSEAADDHDSGVSVGVPGDTLISLSASDLRACASAVNYAVSAHEWAAGLSKVP